MVLDIQSKEVIDKISTELKVQPALEIPRELAKQIQLSFNVNPDRLIRTKTATASDSALATIHTTHATKDTFLIGMAITVSKDVNATATSSSIQATFLGDTARQILPLRYETTTAGAHTINMTFPNPIQLERGTDVEIANSTAIASIDAQGMIYFYEVDPQ